MISCVSATNGIDYLFIQTHDYAKSIAFWQALGFEIEYETDHNSGMLRNPANGSGVFLSERSIEDPLAIEAHLSATADYELPDGVTVVSPFRETDWGTRIAVIQSPDGHHFRIETPTPT
jgi:catechol 2,3-dioxygenase-like lactoylglutathione lyase family enzyme